MKRALRKHHSDFKMCFQKSMICLLIISALISCKKEESTTTPEGLLYAKTGSNPGIYD